MPEELLTVKGRAWVMGRLAHIRESAAAPQLQMEAVPYGFRNTLTNEEITDEQALGLLIQTSLAATMMEA